MKKKFFALWKKKFLVYWQKFWELFDDPVVIGVAFGLLGLLAYFAWDLPKLTAADQQNISESIQWFGVPYGFIIAYVLANVWSQFESTRRVFDQEADTLLMLYNTFLLSSKGGVIDNVERKIMEYAKLVINYYFPSQDVLQDEEESRNEQENEEEECKSEQKDNEGRKNEQENKEESKSRQEEKELSLLKEIRNDIKALLASNEDHDLAIELLRLLNKVTDARGDRTFLITQRVPASVGYLALVASATWIVPFYALQFSSPLVGAFYIVAVTIVVVSTLLIIIDLDEPIGGLWGVDEGSWTDVIKVVKKEIGSRQNGQ